MSKTGIRKGKDFIKNMEKLKKIYGGKIPKNLSIDDADKTLKKVTPIKKNSGGGLTEGMSPATGQRLGTQSPLANISSLNMGGGFLPSGSVNFGSVVPPPQPGGANFGPGVSVNSAPVNVDNSSVQNVTNVVRTLSRSGDGFTSLALQNYGSRALLA